MRIHDARVTIGPTVEPVTLSEIKASSRIDVDEEDDFLLTALAAARIHCENVSRYAFCTRTYEAKLECWPYTDTIWLPFPPLQSVTSITYLDEDDVETTVDAADYVVDTHSIPGRIVLRMNGSWPSGTLRAGGAITITFVAGFGTAEQVPSIYKQAILAYVGAYFENRESFVTQPGLTPIALPFVDDWLLTDRAY